MVVGPGGEGGPARIKFCSLVGPGVLVLYPIFASNHWFVDKRVCHNQSNPPGWGLGGEVGPRGPSLVQHAQRKEESADLSFGYALAIIW